MKYLKAFWLKITSEEEENKNARWFGIALLFTIFVIAGEFHYG